MIKLTEEQQRKEDSRLAKEVLENPIFARVFDEFEKTFTQELLNLEPEDQNAFPIIQAPRKYMAMIKNQIINIANAADEVKEKSVIA